MSIIYNGTTVTKVLYNNTEMNQINVNGKSVATFKKDYEDYLSTSSITISNFLNKVINTADVFIDNKATNFVGKTITGITNTYDSAFNVDWEIIDYNHDSTTNTFDLIAKKSVKDSKMFRNYSGSNYNQNYEFSEIRTWIQNYVNNFSSTNSSLYSHLSTMDVVYNFNKNQPTSSLYNYSSTGDGTTNTTGSNKHTIQDKIKLLSCTELGYTNSINYMPYNEGTIYSRKFSSKSSTSAVNAMIWYSGSSNSAVYWWTRSRGADSSYGRSVWYVSTDGQLSHYNTNVSRSVVPAIRLSVI